LIGTSAFRHGQPTQIMIDTLAAPEFWNESFQNWQSEFLSIDMLLVLRRKLSAATLIPTHWRQAECRTRDHPFRRNLPRLPLLERAAPPDGAGSWRQHPPGEASRRLVRDRCPDPHQSCLNKPWGHTIMSQKAVCEQQVRPLANAPVEQVTTLLICRNGLLRAGIGHLLAGTRFALAEAASDIVGSLSPRTDTEPALILTHASRPSEAHAETVQRLKARSPSARVVILADDPDPRVVMELCRAGLDGVCTTAMPREAMIKALELVMLGETFLPGSLGLAVFEQASRLSRSAPDAFVSPEPANDFAAAHKLTEREAQIVHCLTQGASNKAIAKELGMAEATVKVHVKAILRKVKAANRTQAAMWAAEHMNSRASPGRAVP
jgi:two-component system, NarL family, nitrate/nitrite response regulator NarL